MVGLELSNVAKSFNATRVIHGIDLSVEIGELIVFVGPSGCGKSTLLRMIAGLESVTSGEIRIGDRVVTNLPPRARDIAMVFQDYALYPHKSVYENIAFGLRLRKMPQVEIDKLVRDVAEILRLGPLLDRKPRALSGGQRQRVAMGRAIVRHPKLFLFDEPLSNLDALLRNEMRTEIKKLHQRLGATSVYVTHDQVEAMTLADRIVVLSGGNLMQVGSPDEIYHRPASKFVAGFTGSPPMNFLRAKLERTNGGVVVCFGGGDEGIPLPAQWHALAEKLTGRELEFGIRPEDLSVDLTGPDVTPIDTQVVVSEPLGAETLITMQTKGGALIGRFAPSVSPRNGQPMRVGLNLSKMHLFDTQSGMALRP